jgi:GAF domain-containing protein
MSGQTRAAVLRLHRQALERGEGQAFLAAFRRIVERLRSDPLTFGEPMYRLPALKLRIRHAAVLPLLVDYAVHEELPLVFIRGFKVLS